MGRFSDLNSSRVSWRVRIIGWLNVVVASVMFPSPSLGWWVFHSFGLIANFFFNYAIGNLIVI